MTDAVRPWSCPFCPLLCDGFGVARAADGSLALQGSDCARARAALANFGPAAGDERPRVHGQACDLRVAVDAAAGLLATSRQPLFGGLGTDVAGARALYRLACSTGAICDAAQGAALTEGLRALQDRGGFTTTLAELRTRVDLLVCFGGQPTPRHPEFFRRAGLAPDDPRVVVVAQSGDLFAASAQLAALVEGQAVDGASAELRALAERLRAARYAVLVYEPARLPVHGALIIETLQRVVATLNRSTRAAALALGGGDGAATVNQVFSWLSGLPLRTRHGPHGLEHEPERFDAGRLLADGAVDLLLWIASFGPAPAPPASRLPCIVLGHPSMAVVEADVFIPVATPGVGADGHLFRTDGVVMLPLHAVRPEPLPTVADVLQRIGAALQTERAA
jgi:formylmethanofuran dehydrogenase subunit B